MKLDVIDTGTFFADGGAMFGAIPKMSWNRRYPSADNLCRLVTRSLLIQTDGGRVVLVDVGVGHKSLERYSFYQFDNVVDWNEKLHQYGLSVSDVTDVVLTHLHFDHCGAVTYWDANKELSVTFPNAIHWCSDSQYRTFCNPHPLEAASFRKEDIEPLQKLCKLRLIEDDFFELAKGIVLKLCGGHTEGQLVVLVQSNADNIVFAGDVIPLAASVSAEWISAYDMQPMVSWDVKQQLLQYAVQENASVVFCHDFYRSQAKIRKAGRFYKPYE